MSRTFGMNTHFLLMAQYNGCAVASIETICNYYFTYLTLQKFLRKVSLGEIELLLRCAEKNQKRVRCVYFRGLADSIGNRRNVTIYEVGTFMEP